MTMNSSIDELKQHGKLSGSFYFKHFKVDDGRSTMKVGTDAVLLGAAAELDGAEKILEIGTGCGLISLILAQRSPAQIEAIEIDEESVIQAGENARNSPWGDRIAIIHSSLQDFILRTDARYDLVISNPPFFSNALKSQDKIRNISRHNDSLSFKELINGTIRLMTPSASFWVILPVKESAEFTGIAYESGLFVHKILRIVPKTGKAPHRFILQLKGEKSESVNEKSLVIKNGDNSFTSDYIALTKEFYIDF